MNSTMVVLRLIHILSGVLWAGGSYIMTGFISVSAKEVGEESKAFMQHFTLKGNFVNAMVVSGTLTVLAGLSMYWILFRGISFSSSTSIALSLGAVFGLLAFLNGYFGLKGNTDKMKKVVGEISAAGGPPSPEQIAQIASIQEALAKAGAAQIVLITLSLIGMTLSERLIL